MRSQNALLSKLVWDRCTDVTARDRDEAALAAALIALGANCANTKG